jgi:hypothetical protein
MHPNRETVRAWRWSKYRDVSIYVSQGDGRTWFAIFGEPDWQPSSNNEVVAHAGNQPYTPTDADLDSLCEFLEREGIKPTPTPPPVDANRRRERLEVASRIAAGMLANPDGDLMLDLIEYEKCAEFSLSIADALIAAVDAEPAKPASEVQFKPEGGAS